MTSIFILPDPQVKPGIDLSYLKWIGHYIVAKKPDIVVCLGDFADMPSLCSYDKGKASFEGRRYKADIAASIRGMETFLAPLQEYNKKAAEGHRARYKPRLVMLLGNHEDRIDRVGELTPEFQGLVSIDDLKYKEFGWEVVPFLKPIEIQGTLFVHYWANHFTGKPRGGTATAQLKEIRQSYVVGHKQTLDVVTSFAGNGQQQWGIIAGAAYPHDESYKGPQGNSHWRGCIMLHRAEAGNFDPLIISLDFLKERYERHPN